MKIGAVSNAVFYYDYLVSRVLELLIWLSFPEMEVREDTVETVSEDGYEWFWTSKEYQEWELSKCNKLLIKGKPGCGKSTLMKCDFRKERTQVKNDARSFDASILVCAFFFNSRGARMEKSTEAMLRTILHQLLSQDPTIFRPLAPFYAVMKAAKESQTRVVDWNLDKLKEMFTAAVQRPGLSLKLFIDALDEGEGFSTAEMFRYLDELFESQNVPGASIRICLSSRPDNFINNQTDWKTIDFDRYNHGNIEEYTTR
jgi:hypothetical protein